MEIKECLFSRRIAGETYKFYMCKMVSIIDNKMREYIIVYTSKMREYIIVYTPENCLGYHDIISFDNTGIPYTHYRYLAPWKFNRISEIIDANNLTEYTINGGKLVEEVKHGN